MSYSHILVAVDLEKGSRELIEKAIKLAKPLKAKVSLIHIDKHIIDHSGMGGLIDTDLAQLEPARPTTIELRNKLDALTSCVDYTIMNKFMAKGSLSHGLEGAINEAEIDLIICGHHHDLWRRLKPSARNLINTSPVDLLIVPL